MPLNWRTMMEMCSEWWSSGIHGEKNNGREWLLRMIPISGPISLKTKKGSGSLTECRNKMMEFSQWGSRISLTTLMKSIYATWSTTPNTRVKKWNVIKSMALSMNWLFIAQMTIVLSCISPTNKKIKQKNMKISTMSGDQHYF